MTKRIETFEAAWRHAATAIVDIKRSQRLSQDIRWDAPPGFVSIPNADGIVNPTLDMVVDPRRVELGRALWDAEMELTRTARALEERAEALRVAVEKWGGDA